MENNLRLRSVAISQVDGRKATLVTEYENDIKQAAALAKIFFARVPVRGVDRFDTDSLQSRCVLGVVRKVGPRNEIHLES